MIVFALINRYKSTVTLIQNTYVKHDDIITNPTNKRQKRRDQNANFVFRTQLPVIYPSFVAQFFDIFLPLPEE
jgi:hypothetical protein